jgi:sulfur carrier protein ThiS
MLVTVDIARGASSTPRTLDLPEGSNVRDAVRAVGLAPEGAAVLHDGRPIPLDTRVTPGIILVVIPTFSGG